MSALSPIFADTNLLVAAERGYLTALLEIQTHQTFVSPNQFREFLTVGTNAQRKERRRFLATEGIIIFGGVRAGLVANSSLFHNTFVQIKVAQGRNDAALAAFARATGYPAVTMKRRLYNFLTYTVGQLRVPIRRIM